MRREELELLRAQLLEARADPEAEPLEQAALAGLLERLAPDEPLLPPLRAELSASAVAQDLAQAAEDALDALLAIDEDDDDAESWDALCAMDELCAGATFLARAALVAGPVDEAGRALRAFPEAWTAHAQAATELLRDRAPRPGDPAIQLWQAVEASRWPEGVAPREGASDLSDLVRWRLGLDIVISLAAFRGTQPMRAAAASALPAPSPWRTLSRGPGWELALTELPGDGAVLLLSRAAGGRFTRDGVEVAAVQRPEGWCCPAAPGDWSVQTGDEHIEFRVTS